MRQMRAPKRYTLLLCLMHRMQGRTRADLVEMLLKRMATMHKPARATRLDIQARQREKTEPLVAALAAVLDVARTAEADPAQIQRMEQGVTEHGGLTP
jgi:hypothetical protein